MNILFFGKKREGKGSHEYQRHVIRNLPVEGVEFYGRKAMLDNHTYFFDRFDDMGNAIFVDDQWDEIVNYDKPIIFDEYRLVDDGCPCHNKY